MKLWNVKRGENQKDANGGERAAPRILNIFDATALGVGSSLAVGISVLIGELIKEVRGPAVLVSTAVAGVTALFAGLCLAELGVRFVKGNSAYVFCYSCNRESVAFIFGWALILHYVAGAASVARGIITFVDALVDHKISKFLEEVTWTNAGSLFPYFDFFSLAIIIIAVIIIMIFTTKDSTTITNVFTLCNIIAVISLIIAGSFKADVKNWENEHSESRHLDRAIIPVSALGTAKGAAIAFYGYIGFEAIAVTGCEVKARKRNVPFAILATVLITILAFGGMGVILTLMLPSHVHNANAALPFAFEKIGWPAVKWVAAGAASFGFLTSLFGATFPLHAVISTMANDGLLFHWLGNKDPTNKTSFTAIVVGGVLTSLAAALFPFQKLSHLTVIATLFVYTIVAVNLVLSRYAPQNDQAADHSPIPSRQNDGFSFKATVKKCLNFGEKIPTNISERVVQGNLVLFSLSSIGLGVIFTYFYESLSNLALEAVVPGALLLSVMLFNLISIMSQPKYKKTLPFEVPLIPLVPCTSIFLNTSLMVTLESHTWILFSAWMAAGILAHLVSYGLKWRRNQVGENSVYEINKTNALKLNESIWKINSEKKSFLAGADNPVFSDDSFEEVKAVEDNPRGAGKMGLQLKQAEIIQTADLLVDEKIEPLENDMDMEYLKVNYYEVSSSQPADEGKIYLECKADIHTEDEFSQECGVLEIVDNFYNFLSGGPEDSIKGDISEENSMDFKSQGSGSSELNALDPEDAVSAEEQKPDPMTTNNSSPDHETKDERPSKGTETPGTIPSTTESAENNQNDDRGYVLKMENVYETSRNGFLSKLSLDNSQEKEARRGETGKTKLFMEKLNELLKNQISQNTLTKNLFLSKGDTESQKVADEPKDANVLYKSIKALNKSQIKNKLELLLSKGPPNRPSLGDSFNIKLKETDNEIEPKETKKQGTGMQSKVYPNRGARSTEGISPLQNSIIETKLALRSVNSPLLNDLR